MVCVCVGHPLVKKKKKHHFYNFVVVVKLNLTKNNSETKQKTQNLME